MPYGITQCYLPPDRNGIPAFTSAEAGLDQAPPEGCNVELTQLSGYIFTARCYTSAVLTMALCLCVSVTSRSSTKTAKRRITNTKPYDSQGTLVFLCQRSSRNSTTVTPYEAAKCRWVDKNRRLSTNNRGPSAMAELLV